MLLVRNVHCIDMSMRKIKSIKDKLNKLGVRVNFQITGKNFKGILESYPVDLKEKIETGKTYAPGLLAHTLFVMYDGEDKRILREIKKSNAILLTSSIKVERLAKKIDRAQNNIRLRQLYRKAGSATCLKK